ncbi:galectin-8 isoform X2 [Nomia melanderi]|uniref:galectin-8 isoform X2 n=1 Tax=Nomia melanderi TaxID=2448451 RepID=UPI001304033B|nr:galectin-4-like isoform X2 [Nomia melanderi]XP_031835125.1 galectin-4-like isoform X2 [Nomia melanderi]
MSRIRIPTLSIIYLQNESKPFPLRPLKPTSAIVITGYIPPNALRFSVNILCKTVGNIALHFNARLDRGYVVRNTKFKGSWEEEETCSPASQTAFRRNSYIHILIFCTANAFQIAVNGEHFCAFSYRMPLEDAASVEINGSLEDIRYRQLEMFVYPDSKICKSNTFLSLRVDKPLIDLLGVPITVDLESEFKVGTKLFIAGRLKLLPHSFYVNLQKGKMIYPHPIIALHLNPRFLYGSSAPYVVMNCWSNGSWEHEERHEGHLSWMPGRDFLLTIRCECEAFSIWLGDKMIGEFKHRLQPNIVDTLRISGDIVLHELAMTHIIN